MACFWQSLQVKYLSKEILYYFNATVRQEKKMMDIINVYLPAFPSAINIMLILPYAAKIRKY